MEQGSENVLLNKAYKTMKQEQLPWLENIRCYLSKIGLNNIWLNPHKWTINTLKSRVRQRLNDIHFQKYHEYLCDTENMQKCKVAKMCRPDKYVYNEYLDNVRDPLIRSYITKLRIDANNTLDCKKRSFRFRTVVNDSCDRCNVCDNVQHRLLHCIKLSRPREKLENELNKYLKGFNRLSDSGKMYVLLSVNPFCETDEMKNNAMTEIVRFIRETYHLSS